METPCHKVTTQVKIERSPTDHTGWGFLKEIHQEIEGTDSICWVNKNLPEVLGTVTMTRDPRGKECTRRDKKLIWMSKATCTRTKKLEQRTTFAIVLTLVL